MNKSVNLMTSSPVRKLACAFGLLAAFAPAGSATPPASSGDQEVVQIEMWHGLRRIDQEKSKTSETNPPTSQTPAGTEPAKIEPEKTEKSPEPAGWQGSMGQGLPFIQWPTSAHIGVVEPPPARPIPWPQELPAPSIAIHYREETAPQQAEPKPAVKEASKETKTQRSSDLSESQEAVGPSGRTSVGGATPSKPVPDSTGTDALNKTLIQAAFILGVAIVAPVVSIVCFFWLLKRHSRQFGPLFRIDYVGGAPVVTGPFSASTAGLDGQEDLAPALDRGGRFGDLHEAPGGPVARVEEVAEQFELGPTFEDERLSKEMQAKQQEEAVLQHLFEDNLRLHEQIELAAESEYDATGEAAD